MPLTDDHQREINYLRLSLLDSCNFRCNYCLPELHQSFLVKREWLTVDEIKFLVETLAELGISKIRLTGGEPTLRKDFFEIVQSISNIKGINSLQLTTNASWKSKDFTEKIHQSFDGINISFDSLNPEKFNNITQTNDYELVWKNLMDLYQMGSQIKLNVVVMKGVNENELIDFIELTKKHAFQVRFLETMPFDGKSQAESNLFLSADEIFSMVSSHHGELISVINQPKTSTSRVFKIKNYAGEWGIIPAFSRTFCGTCNRIRITAKGEWINCLYQNEGLNIKSLIREGISKDELKAKISNFIKHKPKDGFEAEKNNKKTIFQSMSSIGG